MAKSKTGKSSTPWLSIVSGGLGVAIFTFAANNVWEAARHRSAGPEFVTASIRFEDNKLLVFVRNESDEALDLVQAQIRIDEPALVRNDVLGAYPDVSKLYSASASVGSVRLETVGNGMVLNAKIAQAIAPKTADQFGFSLDGVAGPVDLSKLKVRAELQDMKGNRYTVTP